MKTLLKIIVAHILFYLLMSYITWDITWTIETLQEMEKSMDVRTLIFMLYAILCFMPCYAIYMNK